MFRAHIYYSGRVQGVGFRYTIQDCARRLGLTGWVKNLPDGRVEMTVEGTKENIDQLCRDVEDYFANIVGKRDVSSLLEISSKNFSSFDIIF